MCCFVPEGVLFSFLLSVADLLRELARREKEQNIHPDPDIDAYMKVRHVHYFLAAEVHKCNRVSFCKFMSLA